MVELGDFRVSDDFCLTDIPKNKTIVNTINAYSWVMTNNNMVFKEALQTSDYLLPDGVSIVWASKFLTNRKIKKIAGADLHKLLLDILNKNSGKCFYLGSSENTLSLIREKINLNYPNISIETYSPPFKEVFSKEDNDQMCKSINNFDPDVVFVGMTAPKQEMWILQNKNNINAKVICGIGAVFDFFAETKKRPPRWMISLGLEWFGRLLSDPKRLWRRYLIYNFVFVKEIIKLKYKF